MYAYNPDKDKVNYVLWITGNWSERTLIFKQSSIVNYNFNFCLSSGS